MERLTRRVIVAFDAELPALAVANAAAGGVDVEQLLEQGLTGLAFPCGPGLARIADDVAVQAVTEVDCG